MNERIIGKLANDAWIDVPEGQGYGGKIFSKEKFAELIVRECASIAYRESCYSDPENVMGFDIAKKIEEHFGVEE